jgi:hypothetical protein
VARRSRSFVSQIPDPDGALNGRRHRDIVGTPRRASACECSGAWLGDDETCLRCGHHSFEVIRATWRTRSEEARVRSRAA